MNKILHLSVTLIAFVTIANAESQRLDIDLNISMETEVKFDNEFKDYLNEYFLINED